MVSEAKGGSVGDCERKPPPPLFVLKGLGGIRTGFIIEASIRRKPRKVYTSEKPIVTIHCSIQPAVMIATPIGAVDGRMKQRRTENQSKSPGRGLRICHRLSRSKLTVLNFGWGGPIMKAASSSKLKR